MEVFHLNLPRRHFTLSIQNLTVSVKGQFKAVCVFQNKNEEEEEEEEEEEKMKKKRKKRRIWINVKMKI